MDQWAESSVDHIMACRLYGAKPLCEPSVDLLSFKDKFQWYFNYNLNIFIQQNVFQKSL